MVPVGSGRASSSLRLLDRRPPDHQQCHDELLGLDTDRLAERPRGCDRHQEQRRARAAVVNDDGTHRGPAVHDVPAT
jgi:hypothetical protein